MTDVGSARADAAWMCGRYLVLWALPGDDTADVSLAHDTVLDRLVEVRFLPANAVGDQGRAARFSAGARAAASVVHPNMVSVLDLGEVEGRPFVVCARALGLTLAQTVAAHRLLRAPRAIRIGVEVADALGSAHLGGVVHGAINADSIVLRPDGSAALVNLGLAGGPSRRPADDVRDVAATLLAAVASDPGAKRLLGLLHLAAETSPRPDERVTDAADLANRLRRLAAGPAVDSEQGDGAPTKVMCRTP